MKFALLITAFLLTLVGCRCESQPQQALARVVALCESVRAEGSEPLTEAQLDELREDLPKLSLFNLNDALVSLDSPEGESFSGSGNEAWEVPVDLISHEILSRKPSVKIMAWLTGGAAHWRQKDILIETAGRDYPEYSWAFLKEYYELAYLYRGERMNTPALGKAVPFFTAMTRRGDATEREFLNRLVESEDFAELDLRRDAYKGAITALETEKDLVDFLEWHLRAGFRQWTGFFGGGGFTMLVPFDECWASGAVLSKLAELNPKAATDWLDENQDRLDFKWQYSLLNGWLHFKAKTPEEIPVYESRVEDSLEWIARHTLASSGVLEDILDNFNLSKEEHERLLKLQPTE